MTTKRDDLLTPAEVAKMRASLDANPIVVGYAGLERPEWDAERIVATLEHLQQSEQRLVRIEEKVKELDRRTAGLRTFR